MNKESTPKYERKSPSVRRRELISAAIRCLGKGGISGFTVDQICREAGVSKGLLNHHFDGKYDLLACAYEVMTAYLPVGLNENDTGEEQRLSEFIESSFDENTFDRSQLRAWLAVWGEVACNRHLQALHRERYRTLKQTLTQAISAIALNRGAVIEAKSLARLLIATIDGLWLEYCLDPTALTLEEAREDCYRLVETSLGRLGNRAGHGHPHNR